MGRRLGPALVVKRGAVDGTFEQDCGFGRNGAPVGFSPRTEARVVLLRNPDPVQLNSSANVVCHAARVPPP